MTGRWITEWERVNRGRCYGTPQPPIEDGRHNRDAVPDPPIKQRLPIVENMSVLPRQHVSNRKSC